MNKLLYFWKNFDAIYPKYLLLLAVLPVITACFIDFDLVDSRYILINLVWIALFTIPAVLFKKRFLYQIANFVFFLLGFIEIAHWIILKGPLSLTSILVISNTNLQESIEFFDLKASYELLLLIPYVLVYILAVRDSSKHKFVNVNNYFLAAISIFVVLFIGENAINGRLVRKGIPLVPKVAFSFVEKIKLYQEASKQTEPRNLEVKYRDDVKKQIFVLIIGESCSRNHMSLYGYYRKTTPKLDARTDIAVYNNVVAAYSNTLSSVLAISSTSNLENKIELMEGDDLIDVFHSAGYKTYWISNQSPIGVWDNLITVMANKADVTRFVNIASSSSFEAILTSSYDSKLFDPFYKSLKQNVDKKFIVIHLMGSHSSYRKRYPERFNVFKGDGDKQESVAEYDNSILYTDFVVDSLINLLKANLHDDEVASLIYLSDHGENVYDEMDKIGHDYSGFLPKSNVEIPFLVWLSNGYKKHCFEKAKRVEANIHKPFVTDDLFHSIMDLNCLKGLFFEPKRSLFNKSYNDKRKRILEDGMDYDEKQKGY